MSGKRWLLVLGIVALLGLGAVGIGLLVVLPRVVEAKVLAAAEEAGVTLEPDDIAFGWGWVQITQSKVTLDRVRSISMQVGRIDVALDGLRPTSIELTNVDAQVVGSITNVGLELSEWTKAHPGAYSLPLNTKNAHARFIEEAGSGAWLEVSGGTLTRTATGGVFSAEHTVFLGVDLGKVGAGFAREGSAIALGFGEADFSKAPLRVEISPALATPSATFTLSPIAAERLAKPLGIALPVPGVIVSAETTLTFPRGGLAGLVNGTTNITLKGYVPPHPFELDGFIFGDTTSFNATFTMPPIRDRIVLTDAHVKTGTFELRGTGLLARGTDHSQVTLDMHGELPCNALAAVEAESRLSKILGADLGAEGGKIAQKLVAGSVAIGLKVTADTRNLAAAKIERTIGIGCGLHPLSLAELGKLFPLPADLNSFVQSLPALPAGLGQLPALPALPSGLPPLPSGSLPSSAPALPSGLPALPVLPALPGTLPQLPNLGLPVFPAPAVPTAPAKAKPAASS